MGKTNDISWDISDAFATGIAGECLSEICAFFCRERMEREFVREDILQSRQLDFSNMERQQKTYYERQVKEVVEQMVTELGNSCGVPVQKVEVTLTQDTGAVAQVTVWTAVSGKTIQQEMRRQTAEACGIGEQQVEVYSS